MFYLIRLILLFVRAATTAWVSSHLLLSLSPPILAPGFRLKDEHSATCRARAIYDMHTGQIPFQPFDVIARAVLILITCPTLST